MRLLRFFSKLTGIENKVKWSRAKKIEVAWPQDFGKFDMYVDLNFNVAVFLPVKEGKTLRVYIGNIVEAHTWLEYDSKGNKIGKKSVPKRSIEWKINPSNVLLKHSFAPSKQRISEGKVVSCTDFAEKINQKWIAKKKDEYIKGGKL